MVGLILVACGSPCPQGTALDPPTEAELRARLAELEPALSATPAVVCFGPGEPGLREDGPITLPDTGPLAPRAARLGHLLLHLAAPPRIRPGPGCEADVERAVALEREALAAEARWLEAWGQPALDPGLVDARRAAYLRRCVE